MMVKTLEHIHKLLLDEERIAKGMLKYAREDRNKAEDDYNSNDSKKNAELLSKAKEEYEARYEKWREVCAVLDDFETHSFS